MPRARKVCNVLGCAALTEPGARKCPTHLELERTFSRARRTRTPRLDTAAWQGASKAFLEVHPFCADGCGRKATVVDHIVPHRGNPGLFWDRRNWQALSKRCHDAKTARENGGFGNPRRAG